MTQVPNWRQINRRYISDLAERVAWTFVQAFGATLVLSGWFDVNGITDLSLLGKSALAGVAATLSLIKGIVARGVGSGATASTLPEAVVWETPKGDFKNDKTI